MTFCVIFTQVISMVLQVTAASSYVANSGAMYLSVGGMLM